MCTDIQTDRDTKHRATAGVIIYIMIYSAIMCPHSQGMAHASLCIPAPKKKKQTDRHTHTLTKQGATAGIIAQTACHPLDTTKCYTY